MDLSKNLQETANCYIISKQGNYEFPLVYGCGIMNGKENPRSYEGDNFLDYKGNKIKNSEINYKIKNVKIISWDSDPEIIKNIIIKENYIKFSITKIPEGGANYILAIFDDQDKIIWSWHLWLWGDDLKDVRIGNYTFLNIPLASKLEESGKINIGYYQWGRKDPILDNISKIEKRSSNIMEAIQNPTVLYYNAGGNWNWIDNSNYWGKEKTIYDPCPPGYTVPGKEILKNLQYESYKKDSIKGGVKFNDIFIPLSGIKYSDGIFYKGERGLFWCLNDEVEERQCGSALHIQKCIAVIPLMRTEAIGIIPQKYAD